MCKYSLKQIHVHHCKSSVINDLHFEHISVFMHKACFLCFPYIFFFSNFILHTLISSHYLSLEFALQVQTHLISSTMKNTMKLMKNTRGIPHTLLRKRLSTFQPLGIHLSRGSPCFKSPIFSYFCETELSLG